MSNEVYKGMTNAERAEAVERLPEMKKAVENGTLSPAEYAWFIVQILTNYIKKIIKDNHCDVNGGINDIDDFMQEAFKAVMENIDDYDPSISNPSTFFDKRIKEVLFGTKKDDGVSDHYEKTKKRLDMVAKEYGYEGIHDPRLTAQTLATISGVSLTTVINTLRVSGITMESLDIYDNNVADARHKSPEEIAIKKEEDAALYGAISECTPLEEFILKAYYVENMSLRSILIYLRDGGYRQFANEAHAKMDMSYLQRKLSAAKRRVELALTGAERKKNNKKRKTIIIHTVDDDVQASIDDIMDMFD